MQARAGARRSTEVGNRGGRPFTNNAAPGEVATARPTIARCEHGEFPYIEASGTVEIAERKEQRVILNISIEPAR